MRRCKTIQIGRYSLNRKGILMRIWAAILFVWPTFLCAAEIKLATGTWRGTAVVTVIVAADGTQTITVDVTQPITIMGGGTTGPVPPVDPPVVTPLDKFRAAVKTATAAVNEPNKKQSQEAVAKLYQTAAGLPVTSSEQLATATALIWNAMGLHASWSTWLEKVNKGLVPFQDLDEARKAWKVVSEGVAP